MATGQLITLGMVMEKYSNIIKNALRKNLKDEGLVASSKLISSIQTPVKIFGSKFVMEIKMEDYWRSVDEGQKPGTRPDIDKIVRWMQHKKITGAEPRKRIGQIKSFSVTGKLKRKLITKAKKDRRLVVAERIANAIYRKGTIKRFGYKGSEFFSGFMDWTLKERMMEDIREATGKYLKIQLIK